MNALIEKILNATTWIWMPLYAFVLLLKELAERRRK